MIISGWSLQYSKILKEFNYDKKQDFESSVILDSIIEKSAIEERIRGMINSKTVFVIGAGPSLKNAIPFLKKFKKNTKIVADSALKPLLEKGIKPDIVITDLDGDEKSLKQVGKTNTILVVHAHGDNIPKLHLAENFKNCIGTTQAKEVGKIKNFGGFTDGDRGVFLANYFNAKKIILCGMDFGNKIGKFSNTKKFERKTKIKKLYKAKSLLEWLAKKSQSELFTTSSPIAGFKKVKFRELDIIIT
ncbi:DUF115 domain-containing protein [Nitrosopumilus sp. K4]|uniref:6-hydroxymethylpterin diphosphokinase MptE-like protein n=1 Tax=Nitrosopumilus sp. K4 TaxID=2795383 RepID=UPI001BA8325C|nr:6-hydroxymethylpterin diphosphokinase MptE-like protein [Nitrosopumilus sp. K4]QUC64430.1 DUF115 domain-containing protein [Nitrosopumilus sp. K4]